MENSLEPILENSFLSITCIASWKSKLIVGTKAKGIYVYSVTKLEGGRKAIPDSSHTHLSWNTPVQQLHVLRSQNLMLLLSRDMVWIFQIILKTKVMFFWSNTIVEGTIRSFSVCEDAYCPTLCIANENNIIMYKYSEGQFKPLKVFQYADDLLSFASTITSLYVISQRDEKYNLSVCPIATNDNVHYSFSGQGPVFTKHISAQKILLHQYLTSKIFTNGILEKELKWSELPTYIVNYGRYCIGLVEKMIEIIDLDSHGSQIIELSDKDQQKYILDEHGTFLACQDSVWCLLPFIDPHLDEEPQENEEHLNHNPNNNSKRNYEEPDEEKHDECRADPDKFFNEYGRIVEDQNIMQPGWVPKHSDFGNVPVEMPSNFSPENTLDVLGMHENDVEYFTHLGIKTVQQFAQTPQYFMAAYRPEFTKQMQETAKSYVVQYQNLLANKYMTERTCIKPDDLVEALDLTELQVALLASVMVFTVRQFAAMSSTELLAFSDELVAKHAVAVGVIDALNDIAAPSLSPCKYGYLKLNTREFSNVIENRSVKSPYVLFHEFLECEPSAKDMHPWKDAWRLSAFRLELGEGMEMKDMSDLDLFSYLCWRGVGMFGKIDSTASARAIFFYWDSWTAVNREDNNVIRIDLSKLCSSYGGKLYTEHNGEYIPTDLSPLETGKKYGCIVLPSGEISWDCMSFF